MKNNAQRGKGRLKTVVLFFPTVLFFLKWWKPFNITFNSPNFIWRLSKQRIEIRAAKKKKQMSKLLRDGWGFSVHDEADCFEIRRDK